MHYPRKICKILIANRGEVALRIQATCAMLGIATVAIYESSEVLSRFVQQATESYMLSGQGGAAYLNQQEIIAIALQAHVDAIHPGYGFLSEVADFADLVLSNNIIWIGPSPDVMRTAGDKASARDFAKKQGIAVLEGHAFVDRSMQGCAQALQKAKSIGFPVIIKDAQAGGGKAMRRVASEALFTQAWQAVINEGSRLGCSGAVVLEKYIDYARHIEVQVAADGLSAVHYYERECSIQRKHQKVIEEAPCLFLPHDVLDAIRQQAIQLTKALGYVGVGTVEFLVDATNQYYFLEINPRLQVEHSVSELITGVDIVALQIAIVQGQSLPQQHDIICNGHAIEARIYAEDALRDYLPSAGIITALEVPYGRYIRVDHDLHVGGEVSPFFDPMIAKVTVFAATRYQATTSLVHALQQLVIGGIATNTVFLHAILQTDTFEQGQLYTQLLQNAEFIARVHARAKDIAQPSETIIKGVLLGMQLFDMHANQQDHIPVVPAAKPVIPIQYNDRRFFARSGDMWKQQLWM